MERLQARGRAAYKIALPSLFLLSLFEFLIYYSVLGFYSDNAALVYIEGYTVSFIDGLFPIVAALSVFLATRTMKAKALLSTLIATAKLPYLLPYYYLYFIDGVYDSLEALLLSILLSSIIIVGFAAEILVLTLIMNYSERRAGTSSEHRHGEKIFDFNDPINFGITLSVILTFTISFVRECISAITFFVEYSTSFTSGEVFSIFISIAFTLIFAIVYYLITAKIKNKILKVAD